MFKLPDFLRPYAGKVIGGVLTVGLAVVAKKVPYVSGMLSPDAVNIATGTIVTWLFATSFTTGVNTKINPTNAATAGLAASVPASTISKDSVAGNIVKNDKNIGPTYTPKPGDTI